MVLSDYLGGNFAGSSLKLRCVCAFTEGKLEHRKGRLLRAVLRDHSGAGTCSLVVSAFKLADLSHSTRLLMEVCFEATHFPGHRSPPLPHHQCPITAPKGIYSWLFPLSLLAEGNRNETCGQDWCCQAWSVTELLLQFTLPGVLFVCWKTDGESLTVP